MCGEDPVIGWLGWKENINPLSFSLLAIEPITVFFLVLFHFPLDDNDDCLRNVMIRNSLFLNKKKGNIPLSIVLEENFWVFSFVDCLYIRT